MTGNRRPRRSRERRRKRAEYSEDPRIATVQVMLAVDGEQGSFRELLPPALEALDVRARARCQAWCYGLARFHIALGDRLDGLLDKPLKSRDADLAWLLELGLYQLQYSDIPAPLVVSETVEAVEGLDKDWARGLVNAVLRRSLREGRAVTEDPATAQAFPEWMYQQLVIDWGDQAEAIAAASNVQGPMTVRVGTGDLTSTAQAFADAGLPASAGTRASAALVLDAPTDVSHLPGFGQGAVSVQDESAQLAIELLCKEASAGGRMLDACAAPGGKTAHALDTGHFSEIVALDVDAGRMKRVADTLQRLGRSDDVTAICADVVDIDSWWDGKGFDAVLLDAPCSGTGVIRRHPDIKLLRRESDIAALAAAQARMLEAAWKVLAPGGWLMYTTCSIFKTENERQIAGFIEQCEDLGELGVLPESAGYARVDPATGITLGRQWLPDEPLDGDGFWYSLMRRAG